MVYSPATCQQATAEQLRSSEGTAREIKVLDGAMAFLDYFERQWLDTVDGWTQQQRQKAANALGILLDQLPTTNNHTEGWHSSLKTAQLHRYVLYYILSISYVYCS